MQRWPKGPFPDKYRWQSVEPRVRAELAAGTRDVLAAHGLAPHATHFDPCVHLFSGASDDLDLRALRAELAAHGAYVARFAPSTSGYMSIGEGALAVVGSPDFVDAIVAIGVAGPRHGIGTAAIVRFVLALRGFGAFDVEAIGEDHLDLVITPHGPEAALRVAERVLQIVPPLNREETGESLAEKILRERRLVMDWSAPPARP